MKILLVKSTSHDEQQDYLTDMLFHGLRCLFGTDVVDSPCLNYMYKEEFESGKINRIDLAARGFSLYGLLEDDNVDRSDIENKILAKYFDLIIFSRLDYKIRYLDIVLEAYDPSQIIFIDGMDAEHIYTDLLGKGLYFKRELYNLGRYYGYNDSIVQPISFAFPKEKIQNIKNKHQALGTVRPGFPQTYVFYNEQDYYEDYNISLFAETKKKGGWDCLRHYEIIGCRSVPLWGDIKQCPERTCTTMPKHDLVRVLDLFMRNGLEWFTYGEGWETYLELNSKIFNHFVENCTTDHLAKYVLQTHKKITQF